VSIKSAILGGPILKSLSMNLRQSIVYGVGNNSLLYNKLVSLSPLYRKLDEFSKKNVKHLSCKHFFLLDNMFTDILLTDNSKEYLLYRGKS
jgi:hypothetical protein